MKTYKQPSSVGRFGEFGGMYVSETLMPLLLNLDKSYKKIQKDKKFKIEKAKARKLRQSKWWKQKIGSGVCHYCGGHFPGDTLTMDHIVPIARGGKSTWGNLVPSCKSCNSNKKSHKDEN